MNDRFTAPDHTDDDHLTEPPHDLPTGDEFGTDSETRDDEGEEEEEPHDELVTVKTADLEPGGTPPGSGLDRTTLRVEPPRPHGRHAFRTGQNDGRTPIPRSPREAQRAVEARLSGTALAELRERTNTFGPRLDDADWLLRDAADRIIEELRRTQELVDAADEHFVARDARTRALIEQHDKEMTQQRGEMSGLLKASEGLMRDVRATVLDDNAKTRAAIDTTIKTFATVTSQHHVAQGVNFANAAISQTRWLPWVVLSVLFVQFGVIMWLVVWPIVFPHHAHR